MAMKAMGAMEAMEVGSDGCGHGVGCLAGGCGSRDIAVMVLVIAVVGC